VLDAAKKLRLAYLEEDEDKIILKAIMDVNLPKFSSSDVPLFQVRHHYFKKNHFLAREVAGEERYHLLFFCRHS